MYLKSLELSGFKSFAKKAELQFTSPVTSIVGPNGSGKSNVAESFRFVLGEQSMKSMRGKRTEDLIWNGSPTIGRANRARVALTFDNTKRLLDIDFDEVKIERVIHRDASSEYLLNGSTVRLKDIVELLAGAHIGASGHHIISQGETDRILNVNARERKTMIEDALGLKVYQYKKEESIRKLEKTRANIKEVGSLRREIKPHITFLEGQVKKVEKARTMREELTALYQEYFAREEGYLKSEKERLEKSRMPLAEDMERLTKELDEAKKTLDTLESKDSKSEEVLSIERELSRVRDKKDELTRNLGRVEGAIAAEERVQKRRNQGGESTGLVVPMSIVSRFLNTLKEHLSQAREDTDASVLRTVVDDVRSTLVSFTEEIHKDNGKEITSENELEKHIEERAGLTKELERITEEETTLQDKYAHLRTEIEKDRDSGREAERAMFELTTRQGEARLALNTIDGELGHLKLEQEEYEREYEEARAIAGQRAHEKPSEDLLEEARTAQEQRKKDVERLKIRLEDAGGASGEEILKEYEEITARDAHLAHELEDLEKSSESLKQVIADLDETLAREFKNGVAKINTEFNELFGLMFGGGSAKLSVVMEEKRSRSEMDIEIFGSGEEAEMEEGLDIHVNLPRKKIRGLEMLSGGERALTSIALLFAMSQVNPPPFLVLDETDAALDEANSKRYGDMIERLARHSQLIVVTHNRETMSRAGVLYGVTMGGDGMSQLLSVDFQEAVKVAK